jgi:predicted transcriptional regulator
VVKAAVIIRAAAGRSKKRIAKDLGLSRNTVSSILNEAEVSTVIEQGKSDVLRMVPKATEVFNHALDQNNSASPRAF